MQKDKLISLERGMILTSNNNRGPSSEDLPLNPNPEAGGGQTQEGFASLSQVDTRETGPSEGTRKALGAAAEIIIKRSKQVLDMAVRVTAHQPLSLSWEVIVDPADILRVLDAVGDNPSYPPSQLVLMASNTLETLPLARECRKRFVEKLTREGSAPVVGSEAWKLGAPDSPLNQLLTILSKIETGDLEEAERLISIAIGQDPTFNHPLIADFMCARLSDRNEDSDVLHAWLRRALYFRPLDIRHIELLSATGDSLDQTVLAQLATVSTETNSGSE